MKSAVIPDQNLQIGQLGPAAFTIPEVLGISSTILQNRTAKMLGTRDVKALNPAWVKQNLELVSFQELML